MQSLQDVDNFKEHSKTAGFSVSSKPNFKDPTGSISASVGRIDSKWKSVTHQAGIYAGEDGYDKIYNSIGLVPNLGVGFKGKASSTTQSAISDGILTVDGKEIDTKTINTNTENTLHQLDKIFDKKKIEDRQELVFNSMMVMEPFLIQLVLISMLVKCIGDDINNEYKVRFKIFAFRDID